MNCQVMEQLFRSMHPMQIHSTGLLAVEMGLIKRAFMKIRNSD